MAIADQVVIDNIQPHLEEGEELKHYAYGVKQPHIGLIIIGFCLGLLPGVLIVVLGTKEYYFALTDRRLLILRVKNVKKVIEGSLVAYDLQSVPPSTSKTGGLFTHIRINDSEKPIIAKFHRLGMKTNREQSTAIGQAISQAA